MSEQFEKALGDALVDALAEERAVGSDGMYQQPVLSEAWHEKHADVINSLVTIDEHTLGRVVTKRT